jgi:hypothetical protein
VARVARGRPGQGPRFVRVKRPTGPVWHIVCHERGHTRTRSTGTDDRTEAEQALGLFCLNEATISMVLPPPAAPRRWRWRRRSLFTD